MYLYVLYFRRQWAIGTNSRKFEGAYFSPKQFLNEWCSRRVCPSNLLKNSGNPFHSDGLSNNIYTISMEKSILYNE